MARPTKEIDWGFVEKMLHAHCTGAGIAGLLGIHPETLYRKCEETFNIGFTEYSTQKKTEGKELLRSKQYSTAMEGNIPMLIWLGKQLLDQKDKQETDLSIKTNKLPDWLLNDGDKSEL